MGDSGLYLALLVVIFLVLLPTATILARVPLKEFIAEAVAQAAGMQFSLRRQLLLMRGAFSGLPIWQGDNVETAEERRFRSVAVGNRRRRLTGANATVQRWARRARRSPIRGIP